MKSITFSILSALMLLSTNIYAAEVSSSSQAVTLCKIHAEAHHPDFARSKTSKIKETRSGYKISLKVYLTEDSLTTNCDIKRDGTLAYDAS